MKLGESGSPPKCAPETPRRLGGGAGPRAGGPAVRSSWLARKYCGKDGLEGEASIRRRLEGDATLQGRLHAH